MLDLACPRCRMSGITSLPQQGERLDCECERCDLPFSISVADWRLIQAGRKASLVEEIDRIWLRPRWRMTERALNRPDLP
jgi:hypothetical protein